MSKAHNSITETAPAALLADLEARGLAVGVDGPRLLVGPPSRLTDQDRAAIRAHRDALFVLVCGESPPEPPPGAVVHACDARGQFRSGEPAALWTWEGAERWYDARRWPPPARSFPTQPEG